VNLKDPSNRKIAFDPVDETIVMHQVESKEKIDKYGLPSPNTTSSLS
jgi:hypothetical protein